MSAAELVFIAIGLAMDAFAVSIADGLTIKSRYLKHALLLGISFGAFQGFMPLVGWLLASRFADLIAPVDHWIAFGLLAIIGVNMMREARSETADKNSPEHDAKEKKSRNAPSADQISFKRLIILSVATSIDALAVGISFALLKVNIFVAALSIALITFCFSFVGVLIGKRLGVHLGSYASVFGGIVLIAIGCKILIEHLGLLG